MRTIVAIFCLAIVALQKTNSLEQTNLRPMVLKGETNSVALDAYTLRRLQCPDWRVRYCLLGGPRMGTLSDRTVLEMLIRDEHKGVAGQAAVAYLLTFASVDRMFLRDHVDLFYRLPNGLDFMGTPEMSSIEFHRNMLKSRSLGSSLAQNIQAIGIIGKEADVQTIRPFLQDSNSYLGCTAAVAAFRLGHKDDAIATLVTIIKQPISDESIFYQLESLRILGQMDINSFQKALPALVVAMRQRSNTTPGEWWRLTEIAWHYGFEVK